MAIPITIPRLGWSMEEGIFLGWLKQDGATIRAGEMLFRLESEKAAEEIECLDSGILKIARNAPKEGEKIPVGTVIGHLLQSGETSAETPARGEREGQKEMPSAPLPTPSIAKSTAKSSASVAASPRARRVAAILGVDWSTLQGSGRNGRIRECDVRAVASGRTATGQVAASPAASTPSKIIPLSALRHACVERLHRSVQSTIPVTLITTADMTNLVNLRQQFTQTTMPGETIPRLTDFFVKLTALALQQHPQLAASWAQDHLVLPQEINIGIAVDTEAGLLVPVVQQVDRLSLQELAVRSRTLIDQARQSKLTIRDMQGGVFTVTNLGMYGIDAFTPIINHPQCAILGIGRIQRLPAFIEDKVMAREQVTLSLTFDHRIVDGAPAARFLQTLTQSIENPAAWLLRR